MQVHPIHGADQRTRSRSGTSAHVQGSTNLYRGEIHGHTSKSNQNQSGTRMCSCFVITLSHPLIEMCTSPSSALAWACTIQAPLHLCGRFAKQSSQEWSKGYAPCCLLARKHSPRLPVLCHPLFIKRAGSPTVSMSGVYLETWFFEKKLDASLCYGERSRVAFAPD